MEGDEPWLSARGIVRGFNPRPRMEGDISGYLTQRGSDVSIHAPAWRATVIGYPLTARHRFQSTPPHGGRPFSIPCFILYDWFQSTPPHGGRLSVNFFNDKTRKFQSTPPHGGRRDLQKVMSCLIKVSIHAPAWRATITCGNISWPKLFQSTPPHGGRLVFLYSRSAFIVSIHAPAWRATLKPPESSESSLFQSTPPHGGRRKTPYYTLDQKAFQSTPPHGGRPV